MKAIVLCSLIANLVAFPVLADCIAPRMTPLPNGASASHEDMVAAQKAVKAYHAAVQSYVECTSRGGGDSLGRDRALRTLRDIADQFNEELRTFKEKQGA